MNFRWLSLIVAGLMVLAGCGSPTTPTLAASDGAAYSGQLRGAVFSPPRDLAPVSLPSTSGAPFSVDEHRGQVVLLYFGYLTCPDLCPTTLAMLRKVYVELNQPADRLKIVFVSVDPERDTLENISRYTHAFHEDFIGLRGEGEPLKQLMGEFGVVARKEQLADSALSYAVDHTASVFLVGPEGRLESQYLYGTDYHDLLHDVQLILQSA